MAYYPRFRDIREDKDMTLKEVSEILNTSFQYYQKYERGKIDIPLERALQLAEFYGVSLDWLTGRTNKKDVNR